MIYYFYSTTSSGKTATCVFKTADDKKAAQDKDEAKSAKAADAHASEAAKK